MECTADVFASIGANSVDMDVAMHNFDGSQDAGERCPPSVDKRDDVGLESEPYIGIDDAILSMWKQTPQTEYEPIQSIFGSNADNCNVARLLFGEDSQIVHALKFLKFIVSWIRKHEAEATPSQSNHTIKAINLKSYFITDN